jgi:hypothetical protein
MAAVTAAPPINPPAAMRWVRENALSNRPSDFVAWLSNLPIAVCDRLNES